MKKIKIFLTVIMIIFCFLIIGCSQSIQLEKPQNLRVDNNIAKWNVVEMADGYVLSIEGDEYSSQSNYFDLKVLELKNGSYVLKVKATSKQVGVVNSEYSEEYTYVVNKIVNEDNPNPNQKPNPIALATPTNLRVVSSNVLKWDSVDNATGYVITISGIEYNVSSCEFSLAYLSLALGTYDVKIRAIGNGTEYLDSVDSTSITVEIKKEEDYLASERYVAEQTANGFEYDSSIVVDDNLEYYYFYLGAISSAPINVYPAVEFKYEGQEYTVERTNITETRIIETISLAEEFINMTSTSINESTTIEAGIEVEYIITASLKLSDTIGHEYTHEKGRTISRSTENTKEIAETISESVSLKTIMSTQNGYTLNRSYRVAVYKTLDVFAIVEKDLATGEYKYTFKIFISDDSNLNIVFEESDENGSFLSSSNDDTLEFNMDAAIEFIENMNGAEYEKQTETTALARVYGFDYGKGTVDDPFIIGGKTKSSHEQFLLISEHLNEHFKLTTDVDLSPYKETVFNSIIKGKFEGTIEGNNRILYGFSQSLTYQNVNPSDIAKEYGYNYSLAIFECIGTNGVIKNLNINDCSLYFDPYHSRDDFYAFGILSGICLGKVINVEFDNCSITTHRAKSDSGILSAYLKGVAEKVDFIECNTFSNGDCGSVAGKNNGTIQNCSVTRGYIEFYFTEEHEASVGGIAGYSLGTIQDCAVRDTMFKSYHADDWYVFPFSRDHYSPKMGIIVGHVGAGRIYRVGYENCSKELTHGHQGDYWFAQGWGYAGKTDDGVDVK